MLRILLREYGLYDMVDGCVEMADLRDERTCKVYSLKSRIVSEAWVKDYGPERQKDSLVQWIWKIKAAKLKEEKINLSDLIISAIDIS